MHKFSGGPYLDYEISWDDKNITFVIGIMRKKTVVPRSSLKSVALTKRFGKVNTVFEYIDDKGQQKKVAITVELTEPVCVVYLNDLKQSFTVEDRLSQAYAGSTGEWIMPLIVKYWLFSTSWHHRLMGILLLSICPFPLGIYVFLTGGYRLKINAERIAIRKIRETSILWSDVASVHWQRLIVTQKAYGASIGKSHFTNFTLTQKSGKKVHWIMDSIGTCLLIRELIQKNILPKEHGDLVAKI